MPESGRYAGTRRKEKELQKAGIFDWIWQQATGMLRFRMTPYRHTVEQQGGAVMEEQRLVLKGVAQLGKSKSGMALIP